MHLSVSTLFTRPLQNTQTIETGLSDFHKLVVTVLKMCLPNDQNKSQRLQTLTINASLKTFCWNWINYDHSLEMFISFNKYDLSHHQLQDTLRMAYPPHHWKCIHHGYTHGYTDNDLVCIKALDKYATEKQKYVRANRLKFMDTELNHAIMVL